MYGGPARARRACTCRSRRAACCTGRRATPALAAFLEEIPAGAPPPGSRRRTALGCRRGDGMGGGYFAAAGGAGAACAAAHATLPTGDGAGGEPREVRPGRIWGRHCGGDAKVINRPGRGEVLAAAGGGEARSGVTRSGCAVAQPTARRLGRRRRWRRRRAVCPVQTASALVLRFQL